MKANEAKLLQVIRNAPQFSIPIYQRNYSWKIEQCQQLWRDVVKVGANPELAAHFMGAIVYVQEGLSPLTQQKPFFVIDGQQRLTTTTLLVAALAKYFDSNGVGELLGAFSAEKFRNRYLLNQDEKEGDERRFKLILSESDKTTLISILKGTPLPTNPSRRIKENFELFEKLIEQQHDQLEVICLGLDKLMVVEIVLDSTKESPQLIFESMNSTGLELSQADLIRNYILMGLPSQLQTELYSSYWRPMEKSFGQAAYVENFDAFIRNYLTAQTGEIPNVREVYAAFKAYAASFVGDISDLVKEIYSYAGYYGAIALDSEKNKSLQQAFHDLRELKVDVAYPFLLTVYADFQHKHLTEQDLLQIVRMTESYVFRRAVCNIPTNSLNKIFAGMSRNIRKDQYLESVLAFFLLLPSYRRFPKDDEFQFELKKHDLYNFRSCKYWLRRLENMGRKELVSVENYTVEHILPQNETLSAQWQAELGADWEEIQRTWLHTLGNLTLTAYNSEYSDRSFIYKRDQVKDTNGQSVGLAHSPLKLNQGLAGVTVWNESAIKARADLLAAEAVNVWPAPKLPTEVLLAYRPVSNKPTQKYGIEDHPKLNSGATHDLFEALRHAILDIDPCVSEEFQKFYVAYKAETNFVDVEPRAKSLRLTLNMPFQDVNDLQGRCKDVSNVGHQGNGDVDIRLESMAQLPYVMGLIRQSFDLQKFSV